MTIIVMVMMIGIMMPMTIKVARVLQMKSMHHAGDGLSGTVYADVQVIVPAFGARHRLACPVLPRQIRTGATGPK